MLYVWTRHQDKEERHYWAMDEDLSFIEFVRTAMQAFGPIKQFDIEPQASIMSKARLIELITHKVIPHVKN